MNTSLYIPSVVATYKHLKGQHNQKRHGYRYSGGERIGPEHSNEGFGKQPAAAVKPPAPVAVQDSGFPKSPDQLTMVSSLGGSTGAKKMRGPDGQNYVVKRGANADHLREEGAADDAYRAAGANVPEHRIYETPTGPVKVAKFMEGAKPLGNTSGATRQQAEADIRKGFMADVVLANWDVTGLDLDNVLVDSGGRAWRVDNGGSLRFRAQGAPKGAAFGNQPGELFTLRNPAKNANTARIFAPLKWGEIVSQANNIVSRRNAILGALPQAIRGVVNARIDNIAKLQGVYDQYGENMTEANVRGVW